MTNKDLIEWATYFGWTDPASAYALVQSLQTNKYSDLVSAIELTVSTLLKNESRTQAITSLENTSTSLKNTSDSTKTVDPKQQAVIDACLLVLKHIHFNSKFYNAKVSCPIRLQLDKLRKVLGIVKEQLGVVEGLDSIDTWSAWYVINKVKPTYANIHKELTEACRLLIHGWELDMDRLLGIDMSEWIKPVVSDGLNIQSFVMPVDMVERIGHTLGCFIQSLRQHHDFDYLQFSVFLGGLPKQLKQIGFDLRQALETYFKDTPYHSKKTSISNKKLERQWAELEYAAEQLGTVLDRLIVKGELNISNFIQVLGFLNITNDLFETILTEANEVTVEIEHSIFSVLYILKYKIILNVITWVDEREIQCVLEPLLVSGPILNEISRYWDALYQKLEALTFIESDKKDAFSALNDISFTRARCLEIQKKNTKEANVFCQTLRQDQIILIIYQTPCRKDPCNELRPDDALDLARIMLNLIERGSYLFDDRQYSVMQPLLEHYYAVHPQPNGFELTDEMVEYYSTQIDAERIIFAPTKRKNQLFMTGKALINELGDVWYTYAQKMIEDPAVHDIQSMLTIFQSGFDRLIKLQQMQEYEQTIDPLVIIGEFYQLYTIYQELYNQYAQKKIDMSVIQKIKASGYKTYRAYTEDRTTNDKDFIFYVVHASFFLNTMLKNYQEKQEHYSREQLLMFNQLSRALSKEYARGLRKASHPWYFVCTEYRLILTRCSEAKAFWNALAIRLQAAQQEYLNSGDYRRVPKQLIDSVILFEDKFGLRRGLFSDHLLQYFNRFNLGLIKSLESDFWRRVKLIEPLLEVNKRTLYTNQMIKEAIIDILKRDYLSIDYGLLWSKEAYSIQLERYVLDQFDKTQSLSLDQEEVFEDTVKTRYLTSWVNKFNERTLIHYQTFETIRTLTDKLRHYKNKKDAIIALDNVLSKVNAFKLTECKIQPITQELNRLIEQPFFRDQLLRQNDTLWNWFLGMVYSLLKLFGIRDPVERIYVDMKACFNQTFFKRSGAFEIKEENVYIAAYT